MSDKDYKSLILKSAGEIINKQGMKKLTVANIVKLSKISNRNFYECFTTKEELLEELRGVLNEEGIQVPNEKQLIIEKAESIISHYGFNNITLEMIAKAAGMKRGTIYKHFSDKYDLLECCIEYQFDKTKKIISLLYEANEDSPETFFEKYTENYCYYLNNTAESSLYTEGWSHFGYRSRMRGLTLSLQETLREFMIKCLKNGMEQGIFKKDLDLEAVTDFMLITLNGMAFFLGKESNSIRIKEKTEKMILNIFFQQIRVE